MQIERSNTAKISVSQADSAGDKFSEGAFYLCVPIAIFIDGDTLR